MFRLEKILVLGGKWGTGSSFPLTVALEVNKSLKILLLERGSLTRLPSFSKGGILENF